MNSWLVFKWPKKMGSSLNSYAVQYSNGPNHLNIGSVKYSEREKTGCWMLGIQIPHCVFCYYFEKCNKVLNQTSSFFKYFKSDKNNCRNMHKIRNRCWNKKTIMEWKSISKEFLICGNFFLCLNYDKLVSWVYPNSCKF